MNDEQVVEMMAKGLYEEDNTYLDTWDSQPEEGVKGWYRGEARAALAALRAAGFDVYRPDECEGVTVEVMNVARGTGPIDGFYAAGRYCLVPVGGDS